MALAAAAMVSALPAHAQLARAKNDAEVVVVRPLSFIEVGSLHFGNIISRNTAATVTVDPTGTRTATGGVTLIGNGQHAAEFAGMGTPNQRVDISVGAASIWLTGPGTRMRARNFTVGSTPTAVLTTTPQRFRIASTNGIFQFPVGATLDVGANQLPGIYRGTWTITLQYQ